MKAIQKKILLASVAVGVLTPFLTGGAVVHAKEVNVQPSEPSDNTVEVNEKDYTINGEKTDLDEDDSYSFIYGGDAFNGNADNNILILNNIQGYCWIYGGDSYNGTSASNNRITINSSYSNISPDISFVYGGYVTNRNEGQNIIVNNNEIIINGGTLGDIFGGFIFSPEGINNNTISNNKIIIMAV